MKITDQKALPTLASSNLLSSKPPTSLLSSPAPTPSSSKANPSKGPQASKKMSENPLNLPLLQEKRVKKYIFIDFSRNLQVLEAKQPLLAVKRPIRISLLSKTRTLSMKNTAVRKNLDATLSTTSVRPSSPVSVYLTCSKTARPHGLLESQSTLLPWVFLTTHK